MKSFVGKTLLILFLVLLFPITSFASDITLEVDKSEVEHGESIHISGTSKKEEEIVMKIVGPNDTVFYLDVLPVNEGNYETTVGLSNEAAQATAGEYQIIAGIEDVQATASFALKGAGGDNSGGNEDNNDSDNNSGNEDPEQDNNAGENNNDYDGNDNNDGEDVNNGENKDENESANDDESPSDQTEEEKLPNTSTMNYNYLLIGVILLCLGIAGLVIFQRRKSMQG